MTQERDELGDLFAMAAAQRPVPSEALLTRVLADAVAEQPRPPTQQAARPHSARLAASRPGFWASLADVFGGGGALAGIGTAAVAGVVIGFAQPAGLGTLTEAVWGTPLETVELIPSVETLFAGN